MVFTEAATQAILDYAGKMGAKYSSRIPLVEAADQRIKLARLSVATACCMFSTDDGERVIVKPEHAEFVFWYLNTIYDSRALAYNKFSEADFETNDTTDAALQRLRDGFIALPIATKDVTELAAALCQLNQRTSRNTIADTTGIDSDELRQLLSFMINNSLLEPASDGTAYYKTTVCRELLESILLNPPSANDIQQARYNNLKGSEI